MSNVFYIPVTEWLRDNRQVFSSVSYVAQEQAKWLGANGYAKSVELWKNYTGQDVATVILSRFGFEGPIDDFVFVKHGPNTKYLSSGDTRTIDSLARGAVSLKPFFRMCRYCYVFDAAFTDPSAHQVAFEKQWARKWEQVTAAALSQWNELETEMLKRTIPTHKTKRTFMRADASNHHPDSRAKKIKAKPEPVSERGSDPSPPRSQSPLFKDDGIMNVDTSYSVPPEGPERDQDQTDSEIEDVVAQVNQKVFSKKLEPSRTHAHAQEEELIGAKSRMVKRRTSSAADSANLQEVDGDVNITP
ncbi:hypothetical protein QFC21_007179 [Naganishia friedmannii]|uniref:Uncharacterized protein n=1 Tax=Naganishia friedmannii TaxID=89922 RepID=A0ACC2UWV2_9TREE|nr:hypothetical protein QFC21_007179 [Naganishia friedmannii]